MLTGENVDDRTKADKGQAIEVGTNSTQWAYHHLLLQPLIFHVAALLEVHMVNKSIISGHLDPTIPSVEHASQWKYNFSSLAISKHLYLGTSLIGPMI